jgi:hypothetical protein
MNHLEELEDLYQIHLNLRKSLNLNRRLIREQKKTIRALEMAKKSNDVTVNSIIFSNEYFSQNCAKGKMILPRLNIIDYVYVSINSYGVNFAFTARSYAYLCAKRLDFKPSSA